MLLSFCLIFSLVLVIKLLLVKKSVYLWCSKNRAPRQKLVYPWKERRYRNNIGYTEHVGIQIHQDLYSLTRFYVSLIFNLSYCQFGDCCIHTRAMLKFESEETSRKSVTVNQFSALYNIRNICQ